MLIIVSMVARITIVRNLLKMLVNIILGRNVRIKERRWPSVMVSPGIEQK